MINKISIQTIKALVELARLEPGRTEGIVRIAKRIHAPQNYLAKVFQNLVWEGLVASQKGLNGGFRLAKPASQIRLYDVVNVLEDLKGWEGCFMGKAKCSGSSPCAAHKQWESARNAHMDFLKKTTIADLKKG